LRSEDIVYQSDRQAMALGARGAFGLPLLVLASSFLGFGALVKETGLALWHGLISTATTWALPGQIAMIELYALGAPLLVILLAVTLTSVRLLPMTLALLPILRSPGRPRWQYYYVAHFIAVTGWSVAMRECPKMPREARLPYFAGFTAVFCTVCMVTTSAGFFLAGMVPLFVTLGLVFLNPIYFMLVFAADVRHPPRVFALFFGALMGPPLHIISADWGLLATGLIAGSAGLGLAQIRERHSHG
jgi:predicted branched-subunit amino acid permease